MAMTEKQRKAELGKNLTLYRTAIKQAAQAQGNQHKEIAEKVVDELGNTRGRIDQLISAGSYGPSAKFKIGQLQKQQKSQAEGFAAAINLNKFKETRKILQYLISSDAELTELLRIEAV